MDLVRKGFDSFYDIIKPALFFMTDKNPKKAHDFFVHFSRVVSKIGLEKFLLDNEANKKDLGFVLANAAGFNKNGYIPPSFLKYLGFDRVVVGTVTNEPYPGNPEPNIKRYRKTESMVNWMKLPGIGSKAVRENMYNFYFLSDLDIPITINVVSTPGKTGKEALDDIAGTIMDLIDFKNVDKIELNISCPNTQDKSYNNDFMEVEETIEIVKNLKYKNELDLKISPDIDDETISILFNMANIFNVGLTITNTTTFHDKRYIPEDLGKGGASGNAVYDRSFKVQKKFYEKAIANKTDIRINACGGINSKQRLVERLEYCTNPDKKEAQIFTGLIFKGPRLMRELKT